MTAPSVPPVLDPRRAKLIAGYRAHLVRCAPELIEHAAQQSFDRQLRACMLVLRELREMRLDIADAVLADGEPVGDWEAIAEERRGR